MKSKLNTALLICLASGLVAGQDIPCIENSKTVCKWASDFDDYKPSRGKRNGKRKRNPNRWK